MINNWSQVVENSFVFVHHGTELSVVCILIFIPFCANNNSWCTFYGFVIVGSAEFVVLSFGNTISLHFHLHMETSLSGLRVMDFHMEAFLHQIIDNVCYWSHSCIRCVFLESESKEWKWKLFWIFKLVGNIFSQSLSLVVIHN